LLSISIYRSDIPLVGREDVMTPLRDPTMGIFSSRSSNHFGGESSTAGSTRGAGTSHYSRRKYPSVHHNVTYKNTMPESPNASADEDLPEHGESCLPSSSSQHKKARLSANGHYQQRRKSFPATPTSLSSTEHSPCELVGCNPITNEITSATASTSKENFHHHRGDSGRSSANMLTSSNRIRREKGSQRLCLDFHTDNGKNSDKGQGILSPDSGILIQRGGELGTQCDSDQASLNEEIDNNPGGKHHNDVDDDNTSREADIHFNQCDAAGEGELPSASSQMRKKAQERNNSMRRSYRGRNEVVTPSQQFSHAHAGTGKRPKLTLPFVNVNDMTIIENRAYGIRDS